MDWQGLLQHELPALRLSGSRVLLIIPDGTRTAPVGEMVQWIYRLLHEDVACLDVLVALGTHQPMERRAMLAHLGLTESEYQDGYGKLRFFNHAWDDPESLIVVGTLKSREIRELSGGLLDEDVPISVNGLILDYDRLLVLSPVFPHEIAGYSGGAKYFFPGVSGPEIIDTTHWLGALAGNMNTIGRIETPVRRMVEAALRFIDIDTTGICFVVHAGEISGMYIGGLPQSWREAAAHAGRCHVTQVDRQYDRVLACAPPIYDDLWTGGKCMYKCEGIVADGGELVIYAPHIDNVSYTHGETIERVGYHVIGYYQANADRFRSVSRTVMAHCALVAGAGSYADGVEKPRIRVTLASGIPPDTCRRIGLGYMDPDGVDLNSWQGRENEGVLVVERAGETLYVVDPDRAESPSSTIEP